MEMMHAVQTYQGIDRCGERLAEEVKGYVEEHPALQRISVVGHSMGGLITRYALGEPSHLHLQHMHQMKRVREGSAAPFDSPWPNEEMGPQPLAGNNTGCSLFA